MWQHRSLLKLWQVRSTSRQRLRCCSSSSQVWIIQNLQIQRACCIAGISRQQPQSKQQQQQQQQLLNVANLCHFISVVSHFSSIQTKQCFSPTSPSTAGLAHICGMPHSWVSSLVSSRAAAAAFVHPDFTDKHLNEPRTRTRPRPAVSLSVKVSESDLDLHSWLLPLGCTGAILLHVQICVRIVQILH